VKAGVLFAKNDIRYADFESPSIGAGEVLVRVKVSGICGSDVPRVLGDEARYYPIVLGHEFAGEIVEVGEGVADLAIGDRVTGAPLVPCMKCAACQTGDFALCKNYRFIGSREQGSFAEYLKLPAQNVVKFDNSISFEQGAFFEPSTVALHGIRLNNYKGGHDVAIIGGGTIGLFTAQWAKIFGAKSVTVFDISDERLALAKKLGADFTINTLNETPEFGKYKYVFETAGAPKAMQTAFEVAANKANVCFIGTPHENLTFTQQQWENMNRKEFKLTGSWMSYSAPFPGEEWELTAHYFATGQLKFDDGLIFKRFPLCEIDKAFELFKQGNVGGKVLLIN